MTPSDRVRIAELLQDEKRSFRSIGREFGVSDWTVRRIARELDGDPRPMKQRRSYSYETPDESGEMSPAVSWLMFGGFVAVLGLSIWAGFRWAPSLDSMDFPHGFYTDPHTGRTSHETEFPE